jgi:hypothetical protein
VASAKSRKHDIAKARVAKAAAKRERRRSGPEIDGEPVEEAPVDTTPQADLLAALAQLHAQFADGGMSFDDFEDRKAALVERLNVD